MSDLVTARLTLHAVDGSEAGRIVDRRPGPDDRWAGDYPFDGDLRALTMFLRAAAGGDPRPFGYYRVDSGGRAVGGVGFHRPPVDGRAEIGYGLAPSARGHGLAAEALAALLVVAADHGVREVVATTTPDNPASQRTLVRAGFTRTAVDERLERYVVALPLRTDRAAGSGRARPGG